MSEHQRATGNPDTITAILNGAFGLDLDSVQPLPMADVSRADLGYFAPSSGGVADVAMAAQDAVSDIQEAVVGASGKGEPYLMDAYGEGDLMSLRAPDFGVVATQIRSGGVMMA